MECWAIDGITMLTIFISSRGLESSTDEQIDALLEKHNVYHKLSKVPKTAIKHFTDDHDNVFLSVNVVVGDELKTYIDDSTKIYSFSQLNDYNQMGS